MQQAPRLRTLPLPWLIDAPTPKIGFLKVFSYKPDTSLRSSLSRFEWFLIFELRRLVIIARARAVLINLMASQGMPRAQL